MTLTTHIQEAIERLEDITLETHYCSELTPHLCRNEDHLAVSWKELEQFLTAELKRVAEAALDEAVRVCPKKKKCLYPTLDKTLGEGGKCMNDGFNSALSQYRKAIEGLKE